MRVRARHVLAASVVSGFAIFAAPASAHVTISPEEAPRGGDATFSFVVPNEMSNANTTALEVDFPTDHPIVAVTVQPKAAWTYTVATQKLPKPVQTENGPVTEAVTKITWSSGQIAPGQFDQFFVSAGPLPTGVSQVEFKALQTYDNGDVVRWIESTPPGGPEPDHPAPVLKLVRSTGDHAATVKSSSDGTGLAVTALIVGAIGVAVGIAALVLTRRRTAS